jgi:arginine repressor
VKERQQEYYYALTKSDSEGQSTSFIEFMLDIIHLALEDLLKTQNLTVTGKERIEHFKEIIKDKDFSRQDYLRHNKEVSSATASRDLKNATENKILIRSGDKRLTKYKFV